MTPPHLRKLIGLIAEAGIRRQDIAAYLGYSETMFSLYLHGKRRAPNGFERRVLAALDLLEKAEQAGTEAKRKVLETAAQDATDYGATDGAE